MKIILNYGTHGSERIGLKVAREIKKLNLDKKILSVQKANPKAFSLRKRFIDQDLNRSFPGRKNGNYEERLAYRLSPVIKSADVVIDIHSTTSELKDAVIVTKLDTETKQCLRAIRPRYALVMNATKNNALISQAKIGICFEYGKDDERALKETVIGIKRLLKYFGLTKLRLPKTKIKTRYFNVVSTVPKPKGYKLTKNIKNYSLVRAGQVYATHEKKQLITKQDFYPVIFGNRNYKDIFGFRAIKLTL